MKEAERLRRLPAYAFKELDDRVDELLGRGVDVISLGIGDPDLPTPRPVIEALARAAQRPEHHRYPSYNGLKAFREAAADWYLERFGVQLDPDREVIALIGSKEGIAHATWGLVDGGSVVLSPDPAYPVYENQALLLNAVVHRMPLTADRGFLPDLNAVPADVARRAGAMFLNYPNNPTGAVAPPEFLEEVVAFASRHRVPVLYDAAYVDVYLGQEPSGSLLQVPGARDVGLEFHSLSKPYNMTGWRIGFAAGNPDLISALGRVKNQVDSGQFGAVQEAAITALKLPGSHLDEMRETYRRRARLAVDMLTRMGIRCDVPPATFYIWAPVPPGHDSAGFAASILDRTGVVVTPGTAFGRHGEGYFRVSLTISDDRLKEAVARLEKEFG